MFRTYFNRKKTYGALAIMCIVITLSGLFLNSLGSAEAKNKAKVNIGKKKLSLYVGQTCKLKNKKYSWKSSKKSVASVDRKGKVKAKKPGTAKITASIKTGKKIKKSVCNVKVGRYAKSVKVTANTILLKTGQSSKIKATVTPVRVLYADVVFSSDNPGVATVDADGTVRPVSAGTTTIRVTSKAVNSKGKPLTANVTVVVLAGSSAQPSDTIPGVNPGENIIDTTKDWVLDDSFMTPGPTNPPEPVHTNNPGYTPGPTPVVTPAPLTIEEYIASLKPDDSSPLVGSFLVKNSQGLNRTVYLLNKNYTGKVKLDIDGYVYSGEENVSTLLSRLETERMKATNSAGTICVHRTREETLWTVEFLKTGVKYYFDAKVNDTNYGTNYGLIIAVGNTLENIKISAK